MTDIEPLFSSKNGFICVVFGKSLLFCGHFAAHTCFALTNVPVVRFFFFLKRT